MKLRKRLEAKMKCSYSCGLGVPYVLHIVSDNPQGYACVAPRNRAFNIYFPQVAL